MVIGYDLYYINEYDVLSLLSYSKQHKIKLRRLTKQNQGYLFYASTIKRKILRSSDLKLEYHGSIGLIKYFLGLRNLSHLLFMVGIVIGFLLFHNMIFDIEIIGNQQTLNKDIAKYLKKNDIYVYASKKKYSQLNDLLDDMKNKYKDNIEYLNIYQQGHTFYIEYTNKIKDSIKEDDFGNIYASKDGMIESFDIKSGNIKVKRLDQVKKGDLLVENTLESTDHKTVIIPVEGKVYAYTFNTYKATINKSDDKAEAFYELLLKIRCQIPVDAKISKENVLQMNTNSSKIELEMEYTLLENIATKEN